MTQQQQNTMSRLRADVEAAMERLAAQRGFGPNSGEHANGAMLYRERVYIARAVIDTLRRNWTVTERARGQRTVPSA